MSQKDEKYHRNTFKYLYDISMSDTLRIRQIVKDRLFFTKEDCKVFKHNVIESEILAIDILQQLINEMSSTIKEFAESKGIDPMDEIFRAKWINHHKLETVVNKLLFKPTQDALQTRELISEIIKMKINNSEKKDYESFIEKKISSC